MSRASQQIADRKLSLSGLKIKLNLVCRRPVAEGAFEFN
jgi:hypothetical protein